MIRSFISLLITICILQNINAQVLQQFFSYKSYGELCGKKNLLIKNFNNEGLPEILFSGSRNDADILFAANMIGREIKDHWHSRVFTGQERISAILDHNIDGDAYDDILVLLENGNIECYSGNSYTLIKTISTSFIVAEKALIGDIDKDGTIAELIMISEEGTLVFDLISDELIWENDNFKGHNIKLGDVDGDNRNDIVIGSDLNQPGLVIDAQTQQIKWSYTAGFQQHLELADVNNDGIKEIFSISEDGLVVALSAKSLSPLYDFDLNTSVYTTFVTDIDADGAEELVIGSNVIKCIDITNGNVKWSVENQPGYGVSNIGISDLNGDSVKEMIWGNSIESSGDRGFLIANLETKRLMRIFPYTFQPFKLFPLKEEKGKTNKAIVFSHCDVNSNDPFLQIIDIKKDSALHYVNLENKSADEAILGSTINPYRQEIILSNINPNDNIIYIFNAADLSYITEFRIDKVSCIRVADTDHDGLDEIWISTYDSHVYQYKYKDGNYELGFVADHSPGFISLLELKNVDEDTALELLTGDTFNSSIAAYKISNGQILWTVNVGIEVAGMAVDLNVVDGNKNLLIAGKDRIKIYDLPGLNLIKESAILPSSKDISSISVHNVNSSEEKEIIILNDKIRVMDKSFNDLFESALLSPQYARTQLSVSDIDQDGSLDIIVSDHFGSVWYKAANDYSDLISPTVIETYPKPGEQNIHRNIHPIIYFSESIDPASISINSIYFEHLNGNIIQFDTEYSDIDKTLKLIPAADLPYNDSFRITLTEIKDLNGNPLDSNHDGIGSFNNDDHYKLQFKTGNGGDSYAPKIKFHTPLFISTWQGRKIRIEMTVKDTMFSTRSLLSEAEYFFHIFNLPGTGMPFLPADGRWDSYEEKAYIDIDTRTLNSGNTDIFIHAKDLAGNWGFHDIITIEIFEDEKNNWVTMGGNNHHTGNSSYNNISPGLKEQWNYPIEDDFFFYKQAIIANRHVIFPNWAFNQKVEFLSLDISTGIPHYIVELNNKVVVGNVCYGNGMFFTQFANEDDGYNFRAYNLHDGREVWKTPFESQGTRELSGIVHNNVLLIQGGYYGGIFALNSLDGKKLWYTQLDIDSWTPVAFRDKVYCCSKGKLTVLGLETGEIIAEKKLDYNFDFYGDVTATMIDTANQLLIITSAKNLDILDINTLEVKWSLFGTIIANPAIRNDTLYTLYKGNLEARNLLNGEIIWKNETVNELLYSPVVNDRLVFASSQDKVYIINKDLGNTIEVINIGGAMSLSDSLLIVNDKSNKLLRAYGNGPGLNAIDMNSFGSDQVRLFPNPFSSDVIFSIDSKINTLATIEIYDGIGNKIDQLLNIDLQDGKNEIKWLNRNVRSGIFYCKIKVGHKNFVQKMVCFPK